MKNIKFLIILLFITNTFIASVFGEIQYISDILYVNLRKDKNSQEKIKTLTTDTPVKIIEKSEQFFKVQTQDGIQGWIPLQYLTSNIPKSQIIKDLKEQIKTLQDEIDILKKEKQLYSSPKDLEKVKKTYEQELKKLEQSKIKLSEEINDFNIKKKLHKEKVRQFEVKIKENQENMKKTLEQLKQITHRYESLLQDSNTTDKSINKKSESSLNVNKDEIKNVKKDNLLSIHYLIWFITGGAVFFMGWITGKFSKRKKYFI